jgi:ribonucleoside-diphosphate reductase alpha chain
VGGPYEGIAFVERSSRLRDTDGSVASVLEGITAPEGWSQVAVDILAQKYFRRAGVPQQDAGGAPLLDADGAPVLGGEHHARQVFDRLAGCWRHWGEARGYFDSTDDALAFQDEVAHMLARQIAAPNSPQWFNTGLHHAYGISGPPQGHWYVAPGTGRLERATCAYERPQPHACFIQSVSDDLVNEGGIMDLWVREARLFKYGSGSGSNVSAIRAEGEPLSGGGRSSGLMRFLRIGDRAAGAIKSGGTTRRAAKMVCLDLDHPDVEAFVSWKAIEEQKVAALVAGSRVCREHLDAVRAACRDAGDAKGGGADPARSERLREALAAARRAWVPEPLLQRVLQLTAQGVVPSAFPTYDTGWDAEAYATVSGQNSNNAVRIPNRFFGLLERDGDWELVRRTDGVVARRVKARSLWEQITRAAWACADPGVQFDTTVNEWHTCPEDGRINASNPCSEYMFLDDTACNLASINLAAFLRDDGGFDVEGYRHAIRLWIVVLEISVCMAAFPSPEIARRSHDFRPLGLGYTNLGGLLMRMGLPYASERGCAVAGALTAILGGEAYAASAELAAECGPFAGFQKNRAHMLRVIRNHRRAAHGAPASQYEGLSVQPRALEPTCCPPALLQAARVAWDRAHELGTRHGFRNAQVTALAPTGTIGLVMDCDTTGIEPEFAIVKRKELAGGGQFEIINRSVPVALRALGYAEPEIADMVRHCLDRGTVEGAPHLQPEHLAVFDCASRGGRGGTRSIPLSGHLDMMAAVQPFISGAVSKTINLPHDATVADVAAAYREAWRAMLKAVAVFRDGSKLSQPLTATARDQPELPPQSCGPCGGSLSCS